MVGSNSSHSPSEDIGGGTSSMLSLELQRVPAGFLPSARSTGIKVQHSLQPPQARPRVGGPKSVSPWSWPLTDGAVGASAVRTDHAASHCPARYQPGPNLTAMCHRPGAGIERHAAARSRTQTPSQSQPGARTALRSRDPRGLRLPSPGDPRKTSLPHAWRAQHRPAHRRGHGQAALGPRTVHGDYSAETRAFNRYTISMGRRGRVGNQASRYLDRLPPDLVARLWQMPPELLPPPYPTRGLTPAEDRAVLRAEAEALAPWKLAIAAACQPDRQPTVLRPMARTAVPVMAEAHAPEQQARADSVFPGAAQAGVAWVTPEPHAPETTPPAVPPVANAASGARAEAHAPEQQARADSMSPGAAQAGVAWVTPEPQAPETTPPAVPPVANAASGAQAEAHAPEQRVRGAVFPCAAAAHAGPAHGAAKPQAPEPIRPAAPPAADAARCEHAKAHLITHLAQPPGTWYKP